MQIIHLALAIADWIAVAILCATSLREETAEPLMEEIGTPASFRETVSAYVAVTKPRVISLLLFTTYAAMVVAQHGWPAPLLTLAVMVLPAIGKAATSTRGSHTTVKKVKRETGNAAAKLSTTMAFSGSRVGGQYQLPSEATAKIENEKPIEELLGLRTQFRDRMKQDEERN